MATKKKLHGPASKGDLKAVKELVELGADVNESDSYQVTPIVKAFSSGNEELVDYLIDKGADINYSSQGDGFPICYWLALKENKTDWIVRFIKNGIDPNQVNHEGSNALNILLASSNYSIDTHRILLEAGCSPETKSRIGANALDYLQSRGITELNELYSNYSKSVNIDSSVKDIRDKNGPAILFETVEKGTAKDLRILIEQNPGIELNKRDKAGQTALGIAILKKKKDSAKVLLEKGADPTVPPLDYDHSALSLDLAREWVDRGIPKFQEVVDLIKEILGKKN